MSDVKSDDWLSYYETVQSEVVDSTQMYPSIFRSHFEWVRAAAAYVRAKSGVELFEYPSAHEYPSSRDFEEQAQGALRFAAQRVADIPLQVAINLLYRHGSDVKYNYGAMEIASRVLLDLKAENLPIPSWFWDLAVGVLLEDSYILSFVADVPERLLGQLTENYAFSVRGLTNDTLVWRKKWFDEKRERRQDDWAAVSSAHFWAMFEK
jgi:hypothetical protein